MTVLAVLASKPVVGSSRNNTDGEMMSSMPMLVCFRSPPDTPRMNSLPTCRVFENNNHDHHDHQSSSIIIISIFRLGFCPCPFQMGLQRQATLNTGSPNISALWVNASQATFTESQRTRGLVFRASAGGWHIWSRVPDVFNTWLNVWNCTSKYFKDHLKMSPKR